MSSQRNIKGFKPRQNIVVVETHVRDFLIKVIGPENMVYNPNADQLLLSDESFLSMEHITGNFETYEECHGLYLESLENGERLSAPIPQNEFVPYSDWRNEVRAKTQEVYGVTFDKHDPTLWEIGYLISGLIKELHD